VRPYSKRQSPRLRRRDTLPPLVAAATASQPPRLRRRDTPPPLVAAATAPHPPCLRRHDMPPGPICAGTTRRHPLSRPQQPQLPHVSAATTCRQALSALERHAAIPCRGRNSPGPPHVSAAATCRHFLSRPQDPPTVLSPPQHAQLRPSPAARSGPRAPNPTRIRPFFLDSAKGDLTVPPPRRYRCPQR
jgi:hypothetical protein